MARAATRARVPRRQRGGQSHHAHWRAPASMLACLLAGTAFAIGHHYFNESLKGHTAKTASVRIAWFHVSRQQFNFTVGTAFAFLVQSALTASVSTAYSQLFWRRIRKHPQTELSTMDTLFAGVSSPYGLFKVMVWWREPLLFVMAITFWLIPFASVFTPGTLSVIAAPTFANDMSVVPSAGFKSFNFLDSILGAANGQGGEYPGPSAAVTRIAKAVAAQGTMLDIPVPAYSANASWQLDFRGPSLQCTEVNSTFMQALQRKMAPVMADGITAYDYLAWVPASRSDRIPFTYERGITNNTIGINMMDRSLGPLTTVAIAVNLGETPADSSYNPGNVATIYVGVFPNIESGYTNPAAHLDSTPYTGPPYLNATVLSCELWNASYDTSFDYVNGLQTVNATYTLINPVTATTEILSEVNETGRNGPCINFNDTEAIGPCFFNSTVLEQLSYMAIMDAFGQLLVGSMSFESDIIDTSLPDTALLDTVQELETLQTRLSGYPDTNCGNVQCSFVKSNISSLQSLVYGFPPETQRLHLLDALEELFQNITLSMMSFPALQPNNSSPYAPPLTNVTTITYENVYAYTQAKLWLAYGLAIGFATLAVAIGLATIISQGLSFSNDFSTVARTMRLATLSETITAADAEGSDPLPKHLEKTRVTLVV